MILQVFNMPKADGVQNRRKNNLSPCILKRCRARNGIDVVPELWDIFEVINKYPNRKDYFNSLSGTGVEFGLEMRGK